MTTTPERTIVLAEDRTDIRDSFRVHLERAGFEVHGTAFAGEVVELVQRTQAHWLILDLELKDGWSLDVPAQIRALPWRVFLVVVTAHDDDYPSHLMIDSGADDYIRKPVDIRDLLSRLRRAQEREYRVAPSNGLADCISFSTGKVYLEDASFLSASGEKSAFNSFELRLLRRLWECHPDTVSLENLLLFLYGVSAPQGVSSLSQEDPSKLAHDRFRKMLQSIRGIIGFPEAVYHDRKSGSYGLRLAPEAGGSAQEDTNAGK